MKHRLKMSGLLEGVPEVKDQPRAKRKVLICYEGEFESMDGLVVVTKEKLERVAQKYNAKLARARERNDGKVPDSCACPLQLDHSESAKETVGRMYDELSLGVYELEDGSEVTGLYSDATFIGTDNVEKGTNGIWSHVSIGADFEEGEFYELTVTPFPAAPEASLLKKGKRMAYTTIKGRKFEIEKQPGAGYALYYIEGNKAKKVGRRVYSNKDDAIKDAESMISQNKLSTNNNGDKLMGKKDKVLKYLMEKKEMSKEKAEQEYEKMKDDEEKVDKMACDYDKMMEGDKNDEGTKASQKDKKEMSNGEKDDEEGNGSKLASDEKEDKKEMMDDKEDKDKMSSDEKDGEKLSGEDKDKGVLQKMMDYMKKLMGEEDKKRMGAEDIKEDKAIAEEEAEEEVAKHEKDYHKASNKKDDKKEMSSDKDDKDEGKKKMASAKKPSFRLSKEKSDKITKLRKKFEDGSKSTRLALRKAKVVQRLQSLRSEAKITPAEIKKFDVDELCEKSDETIDEVLKAYRLRQPVINSNVLGTQKAMDLSQLQEEIKKSNLAELEEQTVSSMPHLARMRANANKGNGEGSKTQSITKLSAVNYMEQSKAKDTYDFIPVESLNDKEIDKLQGSFDKMVAEGKTEEVKKLMHKTFSDIKRLRSAGGATFGDQEERINNIEESIMSLSEAFNSICEEIDPILNK